VADISCTSIIIIIIIITTTTTITKTKENDILPGIISRISFKT
jgi:hypothetical protein